VTSRANPANQLRALRKILAAEAAGGLQDRVVHGGLDKFLENLRLVAKEVPLLGALDERGLLSVDYRGLDATQRDRWIREVLRSIGPDEAQMPTPRQAPAAPAKAKRSPTPKSPPSAITLDSNAVALKSVNKPNAAKLAAISVHTVRDLVAHYPTRHIDYSDRRPIADVAIGEDLTIVGALWEARETRMGRGGRLRATEAVVGDETGNLRVIWFNQPWVAANLKRAMASLVATGAERAQISLSGKVSIYNGRKQMDSPEWEVVDDPETDNLVNTGRLVPVYPKTEGLYQKSVRRIVREALDIATVDGTLTLDDTLPAEVIGRYELLPLGQAVAQVHYPDSLEAFEQARQRLAFDELLVLQLAVASRRDHPSEETPGIPLRPMPEPVQAFLRSLPFELTAGQLKALSDATKDVAEAKRPMSRLLQGDVGSGKTVVALAMLLTAVASGYQGVLMAPTEVLAEQHFLSIRRLMGSLDQPARSAQDENWFSVYLDDHEAPITIGLLTGSTRAASRRDLAKRVTDGTLDILVGTHAVIQKDVEVPNLAFGVVDEQHRFGVLQRAALRSKGSASQESSEADEQPGSAQMTMEGLGDNRRIEPADTGGAAPHLLLMSATPIPRTLALTLYGDLEISTMPELPIGRSPITTRILNPSESERMEGFLVDQVNEGRQCFVVCPLIDESEAVLARAATAEFDRLRDTTLANVRVGLLHGRMPLSEKQAVMDEFRNGDLDVLVTTPVIEVGIDVPNATVMLIEGADRFGLAQLHQLRGRVGRGEHQSYCFLLSESQSEDAKKRLEVLVNTNDGFDIAEADLRLRGPGDFFGTRQSGLPTLKMAKLDDREILSAARTEARALLSADPALERHPALAADVERYTNAVSDEVA
jgi:ATP-dependent DNA helicase RecG